MADGTVLQEKPCVEQALGTWMSVISNDYSKERRRYPRVDANVQLEIRTQTSQVPLRVTTKDISLCGCYVETMFTLETGTKVSLTLWRDENRINAVAMVVTRHPQVGNGFEFIDMVPEDRLELSALISSAEGASSAGP